MTRTAAVLLTCLAFAGCAPIGGGGSNAGDPRIVAACRREADRVYDTQHRADIFTSQSGVNSPQSNDYSPGGGNRRLGDLFERDNDVRDCVRRAGVAAAPAAPVTPPAR
jgi:hypothetical protein